MPPLLLSSSFFFVLATLLSSASADKTQWDVAVSSNPAVVRESRFLDVPVYYGNWVPISNAKATLERVAASIEAAQRKDIQPPVFVDSVKERVDVEPPPVGQSSPKWRRQRPRPSSVKSAQEHQRAAWNIRSHERNRRPYR